MKRLQFTLPLLAAAGLALAAQSALCREPSANLELAPQLNQAFGEVANKVSSSVVVINVVQKPAASATEDEPNGLFDSLPREFWRYFHKQLEQLPQEKVRQNSRGSESNRPFGSSS